MGSLEIEVKIKQLDENHIGNIQLKSIWIITKRIHISSKSPNHNILEITLIHL